MLLGMITDKFMVAAQAPLWLERANIQRGRGKEGGSSLGPP